jgi:hypothetical protein
MSKPWRFMARLVTFGGLVWASGLSAAQQPDPQIEQVYKDWVKRQEKAKHVRYVIEGDAVVSKGGFTKSIEPTPAQPVPPHDVAWKVKRTVLLDFAGNRHRLELEEKQYDYRTDKLHPKVVTDLFDGTTGKYWRPRELNTHPVDGVRPGGVELGTGQGYQSQFRTSYWPHVVGHGSVPSRDNQVKPGKLTVLPEKGLLYVHGKGIHHNRPCLILRTRTLKGVVPVDEEFWIDTGRDSAIVRLIELMNNKPYIAFEIDYQSTPHGWFPKGWTTTQADPYSGAVDYTERIRVTRLELDGQLSDADFQLVERPGTLIAAYVYPEQKLKAGLVTAKAEPTYYRVAEDGSRYEVVIEGGVERRRTSRWWWVLVACLILAVPACWLVWRRKTKPRLTEDVSRGDAAPPQPG